MAGGEIKYTWEKLAESAYTVDQEKTHVQNFDKMFLSEIKDDMDTFHSAYAKEIGDTVSSMKEKKAGNLVVNAQNNRDSIIKINQR